MNLTPAQQAIVTRFRADLPEVLEGRDPYLVRRNAIPVDCTEILSAVLRAAGVAHAEVMGRRRTLSVVRPRQVAYKLIHQYRPDLNMTQIARFMRRDRDSVEKGLHVIDAIMAREPETRRIYNAAKGVLS